MIINGEILNFGNTDLSDLYLSEMNLMCANLVGANLINADLVGANLTNVKLIYARLQDTNLTGAYCINSKGKKVNLGDCQGAISLMQRIGSTQKQQQNVNNK